MSQTPALPQPSSAALASSECLLREIATALDLHQGWLPFSQYMDMALYQPQWGYYSGGTQKFGLGGDFVTAPTLTPLFGQALARQLLSLLPQTAGVIYEFGAGTGDLAATILSSLPPEAVHQYCIIEISAELALRQKERIATLLPQWADKVVHLNRLPESMDGIVIGNEVLDAMPVEIYERMGEQVHRMGVTLNNTGLQWQGQPETAAPAVFEVLNTFPDTGAAYRSELHPRQYAFVSTLAQKLTRGAMIWIDYGFDAAQYYHPQRNEGTLIGHYHHHSIHDPFFLPGLLTSPHTLISLASPMPAWTMVWI